MAGAFCVELQKAHRRHDLLFCLLVPLIVMLWTGSLLSPGPDELANAYSALFYSIPVDNVLIFPIVMAVLASRLWDMEVKGSTWKLLYTLQSRRSLFLGKALFGIMEVLLVNLSGNGRRISDRKNIWLHGGFSNQSAFLSDRLYTGGGTDALFWSISAHATGWKSASGTLCRNHSIINRAVFCFYAKGCQLFCSLGLFCSAGNL